MFQQCKDEASTGRVPRCSASASAGPAPGGGRRVPRGAPTGSRGEGTRLPIRYDLMQSLMDLARDSRSIEDAREAAEICSDRRKDIGYRDIRVKRKEVDALIKDPTPESRPRSSPSSPPGWPPPDFPRRWRPRPTGPGPPRPASDGHAGRRGPRDRPGPGDPRRREADGIEAIRTGEHPNGTSRLAEVVERLGDRIPRVDRRQRRGTGEIEPEAIDAVIRALGPIPGPTWPSPPGIPITIRTTPRSSGRGLGLGPLY